MANTRFKTENGLYVTGGNAEFSEVVTIGGNCTVNGDLLFVGGNLQVQGDILYVGTQLYDGDIETAIDGLNIGNTTNKWDVYTGNTFVYGGVYPNSNSIPIGNTTQRFVIFGNTLNLSSTLTVSGNSTLSGTLQTISGNSNFDSGVLFVDATNNRVGVNNTTPTVDLTITGNALVSANLATNYLSVNVASVAANTKSITSTSLTLVDSFPKAQASVAKYVAAIKDSTTLVHTIEMLLTHEGTNVFLTQYGEIFNTSLGSFDSVIDGANVNLNFTATGSPSGGSPYTVNVVRILI